MRSYDNFYVTVFNDMRGKWAGIILFDLLWIGVFVLLTYLVLFFNGILLDAVAGSSGFYGVSGYLKSTMLSIPGSIFSGCYEGFVFCALCNLPLILIRNPGDSPFAHLFDTFKDIKRSVITGLFYALILFVAITILRLWLLIIGVLCIPLAIIPPLFFIVYVLLALTPSILYAYIYYSYCMVPNILYDNPDKLAFDAFRESKEMMKGYKLMLIKKHLPIILIIAVLGIGLGAGSYAMIGGTEGITETQEMFARQDKYEDQVRISNDFEAKRAEVEAKREANTEPVPVYDPEKMTKRQYIEEIERYKQRTAHRESEADLTVLQNLVDARDELKQQDYAPTHHDDVVLARFKRTMVFLVLFSILLICALPFFWVVQAEFYALVFDASDRKMLADEEKEEKLRKAKEFMNRKALAAGETPEDEPKPDKPKSPSPQDGPKEGPAQKRELRIKSDFNFGKDEASIRAAQHITEFTLSSVVTDDDEIDADDLSPAPVASHAAAPSTQKPEIPEPQETPSPAPSIQDTHASALSLSDLELQDSKSLLDDLDFGSLGDSPDATSQKDETKHSQPNDASDDALSLSSKFDFTGLG